MEEARSNTRLFANLSLGLFIAGLLVPFLLVAIGGPGLGIGFGVVSEVLALFFGILGWADKRARVAVIGGMVLFVWAGADESGGTPWYRDRGCCTEHCIRAELNIR